VALDSFLHDVRYTVRGLVRSPLFALVAILTMAIGAGANTAVFSVVDGVLLKPLPYPEPERLVSIWHDAPGAPGLTALSGGLNFSPSMFVAYRGRGGRSADLRARRRGAHHGGGSRELPAGAPRVECRSRRIAGGGIGTRA
jgi:hypothetical protein